MQFNNINILLQHLFSILVSQPTHPAPSPPFEVSWLKFSYSFFLGMLMSPAQESWQCNRKWLKFRKIIFDYIIFVDLGPNTYFILADDGRFSFYKRVNKS